MSNYPVTFTVQAAQDLAEIYDYIAQESEPAASAVVTRLESFCNQTLAQFPHSGKPADHLRKGLRTFTVKSYLVLYSVPKQTVTIQRIVHGSRSTRGLSGI